ncbi:fimbria/pilus periplasmic chaperone [Pantoea ananatis]|uniref:Fimbrial chaperone SfmC n=1 Tax=Pantoea ananas TaxID=553 RepID=A0AAJ1D1H1_PANAN|nr:fimbria/pilus periplasmic chaperone [Pantoea ananatis]MCW0307099.1 putative fimbrial chaperone SfmC [Pantoea ananatis]MCW0339098.1 putative fimbrial chaperone SfmC [Pantoea ananatis]MCW0345407.1 putative fimbrial chaperone SfmC [Pantoea ananatis]MCW0348318.1 putative fimbrial chaperone SfmC [Pantoea ananatis]MCW0357292.1 putative fimbrial chaperone SfmC [Pantoea ananatis]
MFKKITSVLFLLPFFCAASGGIGLSATRVIFPASSEQKSISVNNQFGNKRYLITSWVEDSSGRRVKDFIVTPPLFVSEPKTESSLQIYRNTSNLPKDRESLFWLNIKSIPAVSKDEIENKNSLQLAILTKEKIIYRPDSLQDGIESATSKITFSRVNENLVIKNNGPYYISMVNISLEDKKLKSEILPPFGQVLIKLKRVSGKFSYQTVNDYGSLTPISTITY